MKKAMIAMSGGVDSAVSALLMQEAGYDTCGVTLRLWGEGDSCGSSQEADVARAVSRRLGMPHEVLDLTDAFREEVVGRFIASYEAGKTPNPCIDCNRHMKFGHLLTYALSCGCEKLVTGHYAGVSYDATSGRYLLKRALDPTKDQSYVLYTLTQEALAHVAFPLGAYTKRQVREIAASHAFVNASKADSQDICFVPDGDYVAFLEEATGHTYQAGLFVDREGHPLGEHRGVVRYTVGQRKGLGISHPTPLYVVKLDVPQNKVVLGDNADLFTTTLEAEDCNFISVSGIPTPRRLTAKVRYRHIPAPCTVWQTDETHIRVVFDTPQRAITPGQSVVLYDDDIVVGGGIIL